MLRRSRRGQRAPGGFEALSRLPAQRHGAWAGGGGAGGDKPLHGIDGDPLAPLVFSMTKPLYCPIFRRTGTALVLAVTLVQGYKTRPLVLPGPNTKIKSVEF